MLAIIRCSGILDSDWSVVSLSGLTFLNNSHTLEDTKNFILLIQGTLLVLLKCQVYRSVWHIGIHTCDPVCEG